MLSRSQPEIHSRSASSSTIVRHFDQQVARAPEAIAVVFREQQLTYQQLDCRVNCLARHLQNLGVGAESLVGVFVDRSPEMIVALLAILKAGGAYVPLDPTYPQDRIALVCEDSRVSVILTTEGLRSSMPAASARVVSLDGESNEIASQIVESFSSPANSTNLAYVIYTSGSTGRPKGVMVEHRNVTTFFAAMDDVLGTEPGVWLAVTSISFDISVLELLWTLTRGYTIVLHGDEGTHTIANEIERFGVTHFQSTPSLARMLALDPRSLAVLGSLKQLLLGGEVLPTSLVSTLRGANVGSILNMYGPTETTIWSTAYRISDGADSQSIVPIGQPLANTLAYVLDTNLKPVPRGEQGELFIGGEGVVRGYWGMPELTAERFLPDPFAGEGRMYRTGDVVRITQGDDLEFLGRTDFQIKLRGFRIELGEIEATLERQPGVRQTVVVAREFAREGQPQDKRLVAYVILNDGESAVENSLRSALRAVLPDYMVPSHFVFLDHLPLTANGKIDRNALPAVFNPSGSSASAKPVGAGPRNEIERILAKVWADALGVEHVSLDENIFDLGATSLMVPEVQIELQRQLGREIPLVDLFEFHTARTLAAHLAGDSVAPPSSNRAQRRRAAGNQQ